LQVGRHSDVGRCVVRTIHNHFHHTDEHIDATRHTLSSPTLQSSTVVANVVTLPSCRRQCAMPATDVATTSSTTRHTSGVEQRPHARPPRLITRRSATTSTAVETPSTRQLTQRRCNQRHKHSDDSTDTEQWSSDTAGTGRQRTDSALETERTIDATTRTRSPRKRCRSQRTQCCRAPQRM
jgi:hypothetical protein